ncbi:MAG: EAL domain-containing protein [Betaproteobacteria bacterium]|nr:MAG: EAL domain-containing protein [Betaproteobacteria bacterium]
MKIQRGFLRSRIARRIVALFVFCALVPVSAMAILSYDRVRTLLLDQGYIRLAQLNEAYAIALYDRLLNADVYLSETAEVVESDAPRWSGEFREHLATRFDAITLARRDGERTMLLGAARPLPELTQAERSRIAKGGTILRVDQKPDGGWAINIVRAFESKQTPGQTGTVFAELNQRYLWDDAGDSLPTGICVTDDSGRLLYCSQPQVPAELREIATRLPAAASGRFEYSDGEVTHLATHHEVFLEPRFLVQGWTVITSSRETELLAPIAAFETIFVPITLLSLLMAALLALTQVRRTLDPLAKLMEGTRRAANKDFTTRVAVAGKDEFSELAASFNAMNARLESQFTALLTFAEIDRAILSRLDIDRVIETVIVRIHDIVPADFVSIAMLDRPATDMMRIYTLDQSHDGPLALERCVCSPDHADELLSHPEGLWLNGGDPPAPYALLVGTIVLGFRAAAPLSPEERTRTRDVGDRVGVAFAAAAKDEQLYYQAHYDVLTALPNRLYFRDQLERTLAYANRAGERFALLFVDLDFFKRVNDSVGHAAGDVVLRDAADRMRACVREADVLARLGGDEFMLLLPDIKASRDPQIVAEHVIAAMAAPFAVGGHDHFLNASIGIAIYPDDGETADDLLRNADTAMYRAKEAGRGQYVYFKRQMNSDAIARVRAERDLHHALERNEFTLRYQPQLDLKTGLISGAEALIRWNHPERGLLGPIHFIHLAEETGLIDRLGEWVLREACTQFRSWREQGILLPRIGVNVSARQFHQHDFVTRLETILRDTDMPPSSLEVEITESLLLEATETVEAMLMQMKSIGIHLALDDFGTGYSSLAYLKRFPVDVVKIDRSFIKDLPADEGSAAITAAIIGMAHALRKTVVAEGVGTAEQARFMRRLDCDHIQGYYLSMPLEPSELAHLVRRIARHPGIENAAAHDPRPDAEGGITDASGSRASH